MAPWASRARHTVIRRLRRDSRVRKSIDCYSTIVLPDGTVIDADRRNVSRFDPGLRRILALSTGVYSTGFHMYSLANLHREVGVTHTIRKPKETRPPMPPPGRLRPRPQALARRYAIRGMLLAGSRLKRRACRHPSIATNRRRRPKGFAAVRVLGTALDRVPAAAEGAGRSGRWRACRWARGHHGGRRTIVAVTTALVC